MRVKSAPKARKMNANGEARPAATLADTWMFVEPAPIAPVEVL